LLIVIDDIDVLNAHADSDNIAAAIHAALTQALGRAHAIFLVRDAMIRRSVFLWAGRPLDLTSVLLDLGTSE
jgi:hypothetical protein